MPDVMSGCFLLCAFPGTIETKSICNLCHQPYTLLLGKFLPKDVNLCHVQVKKVNGVDIENLKHLCQLVDNCSEESVRLDLDDERVIVLNYQLAKIATSSILKRHRIPSSKSSDLIDEENSLELRLACSR